MTAEAKTRRRLTGEYCDPMPPPSADGATTEQRATRESEMLRELPQREKNPPPPNMLVQSVTADRRTATVEL